MAKPLSVWKYYCNNLQKVNVVLSITFLSAFLQFGLLVYLTTMLNRDGGPDWEVRFLMTHSLYLMITVILTLSAVFLFYLYFYQRRPEFGLLEALGHTRQMLITRAFTEIYTLNLLGFGSALTVFLIGGWAINHFLLATQGVTLRLWEPAYFFKLVSTPVFVTYCSIMPVWRLLRKVDPISMLKGEI